MSGEASVGTGGVRRWSMIRSSSPPSSHLAGHVPFEPLIQRQGRSPPNSHCVETARAMSALEDGLSEQETQELKLELLDILVYFIEQCLEDHSLSEEEQSALQCLKRLFRIAEGDFYTLKRDAITDSFRGEISRILADQTVDRSEVLDEVSLQPAFDLSYDQYLEVTREYVVRIVDDVVARVTADGYVDDDEREQVFSQIRALNTAYTLDVARTRWIYNNPDLDLPSAHSDIAGRAISQDVKDLVATRPGPLCPTSL
jgi:hypothetical protein